LAIDILRMPAYRGASIRPWGPWASLGWAALAQAAGLAAVAACAWVLAQSNPNLFDYQFLFRSGDPLGSSLLILSYVVLVATLCIAIRRAGWDVALYLALVKPRGRYVSYAIVWTVLSLLLTFAHSTQFDVSQFLHPHGYDHARLMNGLLIHFVAVVIAAPLMEEILFRGFLYRGLSESRIGVVGAIILTSLIWTFMHDSKSAAGMIDTALHGVAWGWLRWYTGSLWTPIACHVAYNGTISGLAIARLYGWFG
jgi:membrane protease YdiL (CAAX protease family)